MQQPRRNRRRVHLQLRQHQRDLQRMHHVRLAAGALLSLMLLQAERPRPPDDLQIVARPVLMHLMQQPSELCVHLIHLGRARSSKMLPGALARVSHPAPERSGASGAVGGRAASNSMPASVVIGSELSPFKGEGAAFPGFPGAAGAIAILHYRRRI